MARIPSEPGRLTEGLKPADEMIEYAASVFVGLMQSVAVLRKEEELSDAEVALLTRLGPRYPAPGEVNRFANFFPYSDPTSTAARSGWGPTCGRSF